MVIVLRHDTEYLFSNETYKIILPKGTYLLEAYGASGGSRTNRLSTARDPSVLANQSVCLYTNEQVNTRFQGNTICDVYSSIARAGGYVRGTLTVREPTLIFIHTGGQGNSGQVPDAIVPGGHNNGGNGRSYAGSGGGATDFRVLNDTLFHRFLVAGGGGGSDNEDALGINIDDDGSGGSGGLPGQGMWGSGSYQKDCESNTTYGFSFGYGQDQDSSAS